MTTKLNHSAYEGIVNREERFHQCSSKLNSTVDIGQVFHGGGGGGGVSNNYIILNSRVDTGHVFQGEVIY